MKAWILSNVNNEDAGISLVFANTRGQAKKQAFTVTNKLYQSDLDPDSWTDVRAVRESKLDGLENKDEKEIVYKWMTQGKLMFGYDGVLWDSSTAEEFREEYLKEESNE
ncbi:MAG TPA: hypothetical protein K8V00_02970 [Ligilactobacillus acidipiscis]|uniref:Uncharacterized protein n=1 Tax=Ligilactobacillus acidipiscis TaxID=89059 RepID=A0A921F7Q8_9LACO|nr:hypothetical protein [Ligilactobacillus acidipiscis]